MELYYVKFFRLFLMTLYEIMIFIIAWSLVESDKAVIMTLLCKMKKRHSQALECYRWSSFNILRDASKRRWCFWKPFCSLLISWLHIKDSELPSKASGANSVAVGISTALRYLFFYVIIFLCKTKLPQRNFSYSVQSAKVIHSELHPSYTWWTNLKKNFFFLFAHYVCS